jgi:hypothetical protein
LNAGGPEPVPPWWFSAVLIPAAEPKFDENVPEVVVAASVLMYDCGAATVKVNVRTVM